MIFKVEGLVQGYNKTTILDKVSFSAESGEVVTILGPNGSGKSTLIKSICRVMTPREGRVTIDGKDVFTLPNDEFAKLVGYVPQNAEFIGYSTVYDTVLIGRRPYVKWNYTRADLNKAADAMTCMKVDHLYDKQVAELSGGQKQRVTLARALAQDPSIFVFDEPTSALDLRNQLDTLKIMRSVIKENNSCMIVALHDLNLALRYSDKVLIIKDSHVYDFGRPEDVITEKMILDVYGVESEIVEGSRGRYVHAFDSEMDSMISSDIGL